MSTTLNTLTALTTLLPFTSIVHDKCTPNLPCCCCHCCCLPFGFAVLFALRPLCEPTRLPAGAPPPLTGIVPATGRKDAQRGQCVGGAAHPRVVCCPCAEWCGLHSLRSRPTRTPPSPPRRSSAGDTQADVGRRPERWRRLCRGERRPRRVPASALHRARRAGGRPRPCAEEGASEASGEVRGACLVPLGVRRRMPPHRRGSSPPPPQRTFASAPRVFRGCALHVKWVTPSAPPEPSVPQGRVGGGAADQRTLEEKENDVFAQLLGN